MSSKGLIEITEYKGNPIISLKSSEDDKFPFSFGLTKAKKILANVKAIKDFVSSNEAEV